MRSVCICVLTVAVLSAVIVTAEPAEYRPSHDVQSFPLDVADMDALFDREMVGAPVTREARRSRYKSRRRSGRRSKVNWGHALAAGAAGALLGGAAVDRYGDRPMTWDDDYSDYHRPRYYNRPRDYDRHRDYDMLP